MLYVIGERGAAASPIVPLLSPTALQHCPHCVPCVHTVAPKHIVGGFTKRAGRQVGSGRSDPRLLIGHNFARRVQEETTKYNSILFTPLAKALEDSANMF